METPHRQIDPEEYSLYNAILAPYLGEDLQVGKMYSSPLPGRGDSSSSFMVYQGVNKDDRPEDSPDFESMLFWKDWGFGPHFGHRPVHLVRHLLNLSEEDAWKFVKNVPKSPITAPVKVRHKNILKPVHSFEYTARETAFWAKRYVSPSVIRFFNVAGTRYLLKGDEAVYDSKRGPVTFTYLGPDGKFMLYRPEPKWFYRVPGKAFLLGYEQLPYRGRVLLLLSGMKDGICSYVATGWSFLAASGENDYHTYEPIIEELRDRFDYIGICQDPDGPGVDANKLLSEKLNLPIFNFPYPDKKRDIDDLMVQYGPAKLRKAMFLKSCFV